MAKVYQVWRKVGSENLDLLRNIISFSGFSQHSAPETCASSLPAPCWQFFLQIWNWWKVHLVWVWATWPQIRPCVCQSFPYGNHLGSLVSLWLISSCVGWPTCLQCSLQMLSFLGPRILYVILHLIAFMVLPWVVLLDSSNEYIFSGRGQSCFSVSPRVAFVCGSCF